MAARAIAAGEFSMDVASRHRLWTHSVRLTGIPAFVVMIWLMRRMVKPVTMVMAMRAMDAAANACSKMVGVVTTRRPMIVK